MTFISTELHFTNNNSPFFGLPELLVGVGVVLPDGRQLPLHGEGALLHLGPGDLALDQPGRGQVRILVDTG